MKRRDRIGTLNSPADQVEKWGWEGSPIDDVDMGHGAYGCCLSWSVVPFFRLEPRAQDLS